MRPVTGRRPETRDPVDRPAAVGAVEDEPAELPLEVGLHLDQLQPQHLGVDRQRVRPAKARVQCLIHERVGLDGLFRYDPRRVLEDVALPSPHGRDGRPGPWQSYPRPVTINDEFYRKIGRMTVAFGNLDFFVAFLAENMADRLGGPVPKFTQQKLRAIKTGARPIVTCSAMSWRLTS